MPGAVATGGSRGTAAGIVGPLAVAGFRVVFTYSRDEGVAAEVCAAAPGSAAIRVDAREPRAASRLVESSIDELGSINALVNSAGIYPHADLFNLLPDDLENVL